MPLRLTLPGVGSLALVSMGFSMGAPTWADSIRSPVNLSFSAPDSPTAGIDHPVAILVPTPRGSIGPCSRCGPSTVATRAQGRGSAT